MFYVQGIDVNPRGIELYAFSSAMLLLGAMLSIFIFGEIAFLMTNLNKKQAQFSVVQDQVFTTMKNMKLPDELQLKIEDFLNSSYYYLIKNEEYEKSIQILPPSLKCEVNRILFKDIFMRNVMFVEISQDALDFVLKCLERRFYQPESEVVSQNDDGNEIYFITSGKCQVFVLDEFETNKKTRQLNVGHHFGEVALLYQSKRTASVKTLKYTNLAFLCREDLLKLFEHHPESKDLLIEHTNAYRDP